MTKKTRRIVSIVVGAVPAAMVLLSAVIKFTTRPAGLVKAGFGPYITVFGVIEVISLFLFFYPKTNKIGFYLLCSYLGGAFATDLSMGNPPISAACLVLFWVSMFIKDKSNFIAASTVSNFR